ncbi:hypothetical protein IWW55_000613 [Coemansia sp. RSA 2706]|nr:hypothetical protein LPJ70_004127 [Coemansia sp. RSA 2708]KAJ2308130.1 hypothetical protein IWW55_000613 [Coemansia sp. RSA 2706]KAJ2314366.1 hypothetical protein IWW54_000965 [Coemansia sp. RSA 2705]KAJ2317287.1 hypothetical protein IWW52_003205 [Coemansia sp. RSA 2704]KAJ2329463.1 hypothetical protein IWW51_000593 [Coemansia sp. RSA 2702]KAJ2369823.1 hypothetical protein H4S01_000761 [Coemansia sp. RSA 2610]KAJ2391586.1 hypothetical protein H4S02_001247 [Coemansia sp. RSA 2611]KAJ273889
MKRAVLDCAGASMSFSNHIALPLRTCWEVGGELRETLYWPCRSGEAHAVILMIPGNPGLADFYIDFCTAIHDEFIEHLDIICVSHLGHTRFPDNRGLVYRNKKTYNLEDQVDNMVQVFDAIDEEYVRATRRPKMFLCGHSVGCYFAQKICEQRSARIDRVFSLFPAIESIGETPRGRQLWFMFQPGVRHVLAGVVDMIRWLFPLRVIHAMANASKSLNADNSHLVVDKMLHGPCVNSVLRMAADEMRKISGLNEEFYQTCGHKFVMYYGRSDNWVPIECYHKMRQINTKGKVIMCEHNISHAFVTSQSEEMAMVMTGMLKDELHTELD